MIRSLCLLPLLALLVSPASAEDYAQYGTRLPVQCGPFSQLAGEAPTGAEAAAIYQCAYEADPIGIGDQIYLLEDIALEIGKGRRFGQTSDYYLTDADPDLDVYPVRGTLTKIQCSAINEVLGTRGKNCSEFPSKAEGLCYRTTFGDWSCALSFTDTGEWLTRVPPRPAS